MAIRTRADLTTQGKFTQVPVAVMLLVAVATFLIITAEMLPAGLLLPISADLGVTESAAGYLMTGYAFTVVVTCVPLTHLTRRVDRTRLLWFVVAGYILGAFLTALAPSYAWVMLARVFTGIFHGLFWSVISAYPAYLVEPRLVPSTVVYSSVGGSVAFVAGVPLATYLGQVVGWRWTQALIAIFLTLLLFALIWVLPLTGTSATTAAAEAAQQKQASASASAAPGVSTLSPETGAQLNGSADVLGPRRPRVFIPRRSLVAALALCATVAIYVIGQYTAYSYIAPVVTSYLGFPEKYLSLVLLAGGVCGFIASMASGRVFERFGNRALATMTVVVALTLTVIYFSVGAPALAVALVMLWSLAHAAVAAFFVMRLLSVAPTKHRDFVASIYNASFNIGIGGGALLGGVLLQVFGIGVVIAVAALILWVASFATLFLGVSILRTERYLLAEAKDA